MPLFEFLCIECGATMEVLVAPSDHSPICKACGSENLKKLLSAPSSLSGVARSRVPGPGDTACCGNYPANAGCNGPGSCCGKSPI